MKNAFRMRWVFITLIIFLTVAGLGTAANLLKNGDLEGEDSKEFTAIFKHIFTNSIFVESDGNRCAKLEVKALETANGMKRLNGALLIGGVKGWYGDDGSNALPVKPKTTYQFSFDVKGTIQRINRVQMTVWSESGYKQDLNTSLEGRIQITPNWVHYEGEVTTNDTAKTAALKLLVYTEEPLDKPLHKPGDYILIDNVVIREKK